MRSWAGGLLAGSLARPQRDSRLSAASGSLAAVDFRNNDHSSGSADYPTFRRGLGCPALAAGWIIMARRLGTIMVDMGYLDEETLWKVLEEQKRSEQRAARQGRGPAWAWSRRTRS